MNDVKRIGIDVTSAVMQGGGIGRYTRELVRAVIKETENIEYHLFFARPPSHDSLVKRLPAGEGVKLHQLPLSDRWLYRIWHRLKAPLDVRRFTGPLDLLHSPDFVLPKIGSDILTLLTVHDLSFVHHPETFTPSLIRFLNSAVPRSIERATHLLADSQNTKNDLVAIWDVPPEKISVLYSGISHHFQPVTTSHELEAARNKYGLGSSPYLLSVSTLQPRKNYQLLIRAFKPVADLFPHNLVIAGGKGWLYEEILEEVEKQKLGGRVRFIGFVEDEDLPALYSGAAIFVFPSLYEGFGLPLLEAMACGVPVVSSNSSSLPEVAGSASLMLSPTDQHAWSEAMIMLLEQPEKRASMVAAGFMRVRQFSWHKAASQLSAIYDMLLN